MRLDGRIFIGESHGTRRKADKAVRCIGALNSLTRGPLACSEFRRGRFLAPKSSLSTPLNLTVPFDPPAQELAPGKFSLKSRTWACTAMQICALEERMAKISRAARFLGLSQNFGSK